MDNNRQSPAADVSGDAIFPSTRGRDLNRQQKQLPEDFDGKFNLILVAFQRWQQQQVDSWIPAIKSLKEETAGFEYYELPVISDRNRLWRIFINEGMRAGIPDDETRKRTITLYLDKEAFRGSLKLQNESDIHVLLIDDAGRVRWRDKGWHSEEKSQQLNALLNPSPPGEL